MKCNLELIDEDSRFTFIYKKYKNIIRETNYWTIWQKG